VEGIGMLMGSMRYWIRHPIKIKIKEIKEGVVPGNILPAN
jgi:hypothetical protein